MIDWAEIHEDKGFKPSYLPLSLLSLAYGISVRLRLKSIKNREGLSLPGFTVSIGNLTAGGTGKTPAACMMAEWALTEGYSVAVLSRGYAGKNREKVTVVSDGKDILAGPKEAGDEPYLMAARLPGVPVITAKDRYLAGITAYNRFASNFFILDDGYQHLRLKRDLNLLLLDASMPFGNHRMLPRGPLREPVDETARADAVILTRAGFLKNRNEIGNDLIHILRGKPLFMCEHQPHKVMLPSQNAVHDPSFLKGKRVVAFAGIARPGYFRNTLDRLGAEILSFRSFPDHHHFHYDEIKSLIREKEKTGADFLITTEKDWIKVSSLLSGNPYASYLTVSFDFLNDREAFFRMVRERIREQP